MTAHIALKLFASLKRYTPAQADRFSITPGLTIADLLKELNVPLAEVKLVFVNGVKQDMNMPLKDGDRVGIFPAVGGG
ncbi:MAG: MoaD/ThiS family protein [Deltaproteobacteria bacterium]|nr:MoaD/ThiS family protein [Deltaproteobacteria bacterium]